MTDSRRPGMAESGRPDAAANSAQAFLLESVPAEKRSEKSPMKAAIKAYNEYRGLIRHKKAN